MARRSRAREVALQALFQEDVNPHASVKALNAFLSGRIADAELQDFARSLVLGVKRNQAELDQLLESVAQNWALSRMANTDRNILRIGAYEVRYSETPPKVAINEAVELAKRFGAAQSSQFVNGILDKLAQQQDAPRQEAPYQEGEDE